MATHRLPWNVDRPDVPNPERHIPGHGHGRLTKDKYESQRTQRSAYAVLPHLITKSSPAEITRILVAFPEVELANEKELEAGRPGPERGDEIEDSELKPFEFPDWQL